MSPYISGMALIFTNNMLYVGFEYENNLTREKILNTFKACKVYLNTDKQIIFSIKYR